MSNVAVLLSPGFADWEYGLIAGTGGPYYGLDVRLFGTRTGALRSQGGLDVTLAQGPDHLADWCPQVLAVIGGTGWERPEAPDVTALLTGLHDRGTVIAGICGGTIALARAELLNAVRHTSNGGAFLTANAAPYAGAHLYVESPRAIRDEAVVTAPGSAPASFAAAVFAAAGVPADTIAQFRQMMAAEHTESADRSSG